MTRVTDSGHEKGAFESERRRALLARAEGRVEAEREAVDRALALADALHFEPEVQSSLIELLLTVGRLEDAALHLEASLPRVPPAEAASLRIKLAATYLRLGRLEASVSLARSAAEEEPSGRLSLILGSALRYQGRLEDARLPLEAALRAAEARRDTALAVAALCAKGELELDADDPKEAVILFGRAFGLTEYSSNKAPSVLPLAGLAQAQGAWGYPAKGAEVAEKALGRAERQGDRVGLARALLSLGLLTRRAPLLLRAAAEADAAPHLPLALKVFVALARVEPSTVRVTEAMRLARSFGMALDLHRLETLRG